MNARELQDLLRDLIEDHLFARDGIAGPPTEFEQRIHSIRQICTFDDVGMLTENKGLVVECADGSELQVTIIRSK